MILVIDIKSTCCNLGPIPPEAMEVIKVGAF